MNSGYRSGGVRLLDLISTWSMSKEQPGSGQLSEAMKVPKSAALGWFFPDDG